MKPGEEQPEQEPQRSMFRTPCAVIAAVVGCLGLGLALIAWRSPGALGPSLRAAEESAKVKKPQQKGILPFSVLFKSNFTHKLIATGPKEEWVRIGQENLTQYFTEEEIDSLPLSGKEFKCDMDKIPQHCCIGAFSMAGIMTWRQGACENGDYLRFLGPHEGRQSSLYRDMGDVIAALGNRTISFLGDSIASQHAHAMECSWLRSGKARTVSYDRIDYGRIFNKQGLFSKAGVYGTNTITTWLVATPEMEAKNITATVKFYLQYRPFANMNETHAIMREADVLVVNFGLHWMVQHDDIYRAEMTLLFNKLRDFAATPGKTLVWRETSAQHFLREGGEYPPFDMNVYGMSKSEWDVQSGRCHPLRFGPTIEPQWRDRMVLEILKDGRYTVDWLGGRGGALEGVAKGRREAGGCEARGEEAGRNGEKDGVAEAEGGAVGDHQGSHEVKDPEQAGSLENAEGEKGEMREVTARGQVRRALAEEYAWMQEDDGKRPVVYWMPFFHLTSGLMDLHPYNMVKDKMDCTHYCYTPYMYEPVVEQLARAIDASDSRVKGC